MKRIEAIVLFAQANGANGGGTDWPLVVIGIALVVLVIGSCVLFFTRRVNADDEGTVSYTSRMVRVTTKGLPADPTEAHRMVTAKLENSERAARLITDDQKRARAQKRLKEIRERYDQMAASHERDGISLFNMQLLWSYLGDHDDNLREEEKRPDDQAVLLLAPDGFPEQGSVSGDTYGATGSDEGEERHTEHHDVHDAHSSSESVEIDSGPHYDSSPDSGADYNSPSDSGVDYSSPSDTGSDFSSSGGD